MRRSELQVTSQEELEDILGQATVCRLGLCDRGTPYVVPLNFGYREGTFYFHSALQGRKVEVLKTNPNVCLEFDLDLGLVKHEKACNWGNRYKSVIGTGLAKEITDHAGKVEALNIIMKKYSGKDYVFPEKAVANTFVFAVESRELVGKQTSQSTIVD